MTNWSNKKKMTPKQVEVSLYIYIYIYIVFHAIIDIDIATHPALQSFQIHLVCCHSTIINCTPRVLTTASPISFGRFVVYLFPFSHFTIVFFFFLVYSHDQSSQGFTTQLSPVGTSLCTQFTSPRISWDRPGARSNSVLTALFSMLNSYFNYVL
jgi:hypothetical protein